MAKIELSKGHAITLDMCPRYIGREWTNITLANASFKMGQPEVNLLDAEKASEYLVRNMVKKIDLGDGIEKDFTDEILDNLPDHDYLKLVVAVTNIKSGNVEGKKK